MNARESLPRSSRGRQQQEAQRRRQQLPGGPRSGRLVIPPRLTERRVKRARRRCPRTRSALATAMGSDTLTA